MTCTEASRPHFNGNSQAQSASISGLWASLSTTAILPLLNTRARWFPASHDRFFCQFSCYGDSTVPGSTLSSVPVGISTCALPAISSSRPKISLAYHRCRDTQPSFEQGQEVLPRIPLGFSSSLHVNMSYDASRTQTKTAQYVGA